MTFTNKKIQSEMFKFIGEFLRQARIKAGLTQWNVAIELDYTSPQFISNFERGLCAPSKETISKLAMMYDFDRKEFLMKVLNFQKADMESVLGIPSNTEIAFATVPTKPMIPSSVLQVNTSNLVQ